jgi:hypothetical protein
MRLAPQPGGIGPGPESSATPCLPPADSRAVRQSTSRSTISRQSRRHSSGSPHSCACACAPVTRLRRSDARDMDPASPPRPPESAPHAPPGRERRDRSRNSGCTPIVPPLGSPDVCLGERAAQSSRNRGGVDEHHNGDLIRQRLSPRATHRRPRGRVCVTPAIAPSATSPDFRPTCSTSNAH